MPEQIFFEKGSKLEPEGESVLFGPWIGEFGWELMSWQAWCRRVSKNFTKSYTCSFPDMEYLYADYSTFIPHRHTKRHLDWNDVSLVDFDLPEDITHQILPFKHYRLPNQEFIKFGGDNLLLPKQYIIHARGINKGGKNYPLPLWIELVQLMKSNIDPITIVSVGSKDDLHIPGTLDLRGVVLHELCIHLNQAQMVIGQSSGVMHLATLCGAPCVVWGDSRTYFGETLEKRYKETWNPFHVPISFIYDDRWQPEPQAIWNVIGLQIKTETPQMPVIDKAIQINTETPEIRKIPMNDFKAPLALKEPLTAAIKSKRYFITLSWLEKPEVIKHHSLSRNFPNADYAKSLEHLLKEVSERHPEVPPMHEKATHSEFIDMDEVALEPEVAKEGTITWV